MNERTIEGVHFIARRDGKAWVAEVQTPHRLPQQYHSRPAMWADLERIARVIGRERFRRDTIGTGDET